MRTTYVQGPLVLELAGFAGVEENVKRVALTDEYGIVTVSFGNLTSPLLSVLPHKTDVVTCPGCDSGKTIGHEAHLRIRQILRQVC